MLQNVKFVPVNNVHLHESHEEARLETVSSKILDDGYLQSPLLVTKTKDQEYFVIDGVHRYHSLRLAGFAQVPVQVINPEHINLSSWAHEVPKGSWLDQLRSDPSFVWQAQPSVGWVASMLDEDGIKLWLVPAKPTRGRTKRLANWHRVVDSYTQHAVIRRVPSDAKENPAVGHVRFTFPIWDVKDIEKSVAKKAVLPCGTTRFIVKNRLDNLRIPLSLLNQIGIFSPLLLL